MPNFVAKNPAAQTPLMPTATAEFSIADALAQFDIHIEPLVTAQLVNNSRQINQGDVFCAVIGTASDGRNYIDQAIAAGASLVIAECQQPQQHGNQLVREKTTGKVTKKVTIVQFYQLNQHLFELAASYYQNPQDKLRLIGVTGTNGKTSTSQMIASLLNLCQQNITPQSQGEKLVAKAAVIGTTGAGVLPELTPIANTTPGATELNQIFASFAEQSVSHVAMEVSSHALDQGRIAAGQISVAVFTNLSRDHLDYHQTMAQYAQAKFGIFTDSAISAPQAASTAQHSSQVAVINGDDEYGRAWLAKLNQSSIAFGKGESVSQHKRFVKAQDIRLSPSGVSFTVVTESANAKVASKLLGEFNVDNLLAAIASLLALDIPLELIVPYIAELQPSQGRMEAFHQTDKPVAVVDYAHTPDALANALQACRHHCDGELWVVFGCGGDRDKGKRSQMGQVAERFADHVVVTNDNPRSEAPELIANDILSGCQHAEKVTVMLERSQAVRSTLAHAKPNDVVLLAGKGHENTIEIAGQIIEYNERALVASIYQAGEQ
ncbi:UDP-N-acetylmuramoyl-L-alanyl-D-glutamate--2,6-diaminopimelate ligase [Thalassotalea euphylliae]|uniref:UDP-N-acetylmuramoyl-L-alanyl-D-glutamate--2,6-diaminopimelate ligase n=1 Tax=Thalassotalea euphylliae TaxID=1655234 RepID=A0A3E0TVV0_9GAMM|nr:UDP-N-acetylmuramoyl-L-alanyl-D-glutamate--2,6-diaminopimelate ligase [Thalassotalea euphylliae]REL28075.1 UDP-N-acetylmuramoyl-L-alanyl-D-glutamate--2,6-diaminopimelate ligase [Thalassotalea euphylliae]